MPRQTLAETLRAGTTVVSAWVTLPEPLVAEAVARSAFGAVTLDQPEPAQCWMTVRYAFDDDSPPADQR